MDHTERAETNARFTSALRGAIPTPTTRAAVLPARRPTPARTATTPMTMMWAHPHVLWSTVTTRPSRALVDHRRAARGARHVPVLEPASVSERPCRVTRRRGPWTPMPQQDVAGADVPASSAPHERRPPLALHAS